MIIEGIDTKDISVVIQGAIDKVNTPLCISSIRKYLPESTIILSTWKGADITNLKCDKILLNADPGGYKDRFVKSFTNNTLRQLVSTQNGLKLVKTKYAIKMRSDLILESNKFLKYFNMFPCREPEYTFFNQRVILSSFFAKKYLYSNGIVQPVPFHISDWFAFGLSEDIRKLYNVELPQEPDSSWYLYEKPYTGSKVNLLNASHQYAPEQYIAYKAFKSKFDINFKHYMDYNEENIMMSERLMVNNFIILCPTQFKFICGKNNTGSDYYKKWTKHPSKIPTLLWKGLYRHDIFLEEYKKYCDADYTIPKKVKLRNIMEKIRHKNKK